MNQQHSIGSLFQSWDHPTSKSHVEKLTKLWKLTNVGQFDMDDIERGFFATLPSGNVLRLGNNSMLVYPPPEIQEKAPYKLFASTDCFPSMSFEVATQRLQTLEKTLKRKVAEAIGDEHADPRQRLDKRFAQFEKELIDFIHDVRETDIMKDYGAGVNTNLTPDPTVVTFMYGVNDRDELDVLLRLLPRELTRLHARYPLLKDMLRFDDVPDLAVANFVAFRFNKTHTFDVDYGLSHHWKRLIAPMMERVHQSISKPRVTEAAIPKPPALQRIMNDFEPGTFKDWRIQSAGGALAKYGQTWTLFFNTDDHDEADILYRLIKTSVKRELGNDAHTNQFGKDRPKMGLGATILVPKKPASDWGSIKEARWDNGQDRVHQFKQLAADLQEIKETEGLPYLRSFPYQHAIIIGLERGADEDERKLLLKLVTKKTSKMSALHTIQATSWDNGPAIGVYISNYNGVERELKAAWRPVKEGLLSDWIGSVDTGVAHQFDNLMEPYINWINAALDTVTDEAGLLEFDAGLSIGNESVMLELMCRHPDEDAHALWLKLAKKALERTAPADVKVELQHSHGQVEQWVADMTRYPEVDTPDWVHHLTIDINNVDAFVSASSCSSRFRSDYMRRALDERWREDSFDNNRHDLTVN